MHISMWHISIENIHHILSIFYDDASKDEPKSHEISFVYNILCGYPVVSNFSTEHGSIPTLLCAKFENDCDTVYMEKIFLEILV